MTPTSTQGPLRRRRQAGFTLIELLVVIIILGILSAVVVFAVRGAGDKGQEAAVATDERTIRSAQETYCAREGRYASMDELVAGKYLSAPSEIHTVAPVGPGDTDRQGNCGAALDTRHYKITCLLADCGVGPPDPNDPVETCDPLVGPTVGGPGVLDSTFDTDGKQTTDFDGTNTKFDQANAVAIDVDDKIVIAGSSGGGAFPVVRYDPCGGLDPAFDSDGKRTTQFPAPPGASITTADASAVAIDSARNIVVAGTVLVENGDGTEHTDFAVARYTSTGVLDETFSEDGMVTTDFGTASSDSGRDLAIDGDGKIVVVGTTDDKFALARYGPDGSPDLLFDDDGEVVTDMENYHVDGFSLPGVANAVVIDSNAKILVAGFATPNPGQANIAGNDTAFARYNPEDGSLDPLFGVGGKVYFDGGYQEGADSLVLQPDDGKIVAAGTVTYVGDTQKKVAVVRLNADGTRDAGFGVQYETDLGRVPGAGLFATGFGGSSFSVGSGVALQSDDKIVVGATSQRTDGRMQFAVLRLTTAGDFDPEFGGVTGKGRVFTDFGGTDQVFAIAIHRSGSKTDRVVVAGTGSVDADFALARYLPS